MRVPSFIFTLSVLFINVSGGNSFVLQTEPESVRAFLFSLTENVKEQMSNIDPGQYDYKRYVAVWASKAGKSPQQAANEIKQWVAQYDRKKSDLYNLGLAKFYLKDFSGAIDYLNQSINVTVAKLQKLPQKESGLSENQKALFKEGVQTLRVLGNIFYLNYDFVNALKSYQQAIKFTSKTETPEVWAKIVLDMAQTYSEVGRRSDPKDTGKIFENSIQAFKQALTVFTVGKNPQDWARAQNGLGTTLALNGLRLKKDAGLTYLQQGADAITKCLQVLKKDDMPFIWAKAKNNLGSALAEIGVRKGGEEGSQSLLDAIKAYKAALEVRTMADTPNEWAQTQNNLAAAYAFFKDWKNVLDCYIKVLKVNPEDKFAYQTAEDLSQKVLFDFPLALKLNEGWMKSHPDDLLEKVKLVEKYFTNGEFVKSQKLIAEFRKSKDYSQLVYVIMDLMDVVNDIALNQTGAVPEKLGQLLDRIKIQPESFRVSMNFSGLKYFVSTNTSLKPYEDWLLRYFSAFENQKRDEIYVELKDVKETFHFAGK